MALPNQIIEYFCAKLHQTAAATPMHELKIKQP
jgi:hypothetical protein